MPLPPFRWRSLLSAQSLRLLAFFSLAAVSPAIVNAASIWYFMKMRLSGYAGWYALPEWYQVAFYVLLFWFVCRRLWPRFAAAAPTRRQVMIGLITYLIILGLSYAVFHLPDGPLAVLAAFNLAHPKLGMFAVGTGLRLAFVLPSLVSASMFFAWSDIRRLLPALSGSAVILLVYSGLRLCQYYYAGVLGRPLAYFTRGLLQLLPYHEPVSGNELTMTYGHFTATMGSLCIGYDAIFLFVMLFAAALLIAGRSQRIRADRTIIAFVVAIVLLYFVNVVRVAGIMIVGAQSSATATELFHEGIGALLVFALLLIYLRWVLPWICRPDALMKKRA